MNLGGILIAWLVTAVSLYLISMLPLGVEISSFKKALVSAAVFGIINALLGPVFRLITWPFTFITFGLFAFVVNAVIFGLAAWLVHGFRLRYGFWSALLGAIALSFINSFLFSLIR